MKSLDDILQEIGSTAEYGFAGSITVDQRSVWGDTPLHVACRWGDAEAVAVLVTAGADIDAIGEAHMSPLAAASLAANSFEVVDLLLRHGANISVRDQDGNTPLDNAEIALSLARDKGLDITQPTRIVELLKSAPQVDGMCAT